MPQTELAKVAKELSEVDWNLYDIKLVRLQLALAKRSGDSKKQKKLEKKLERLWKERYR